MRRDMRKGSLLPGKGVRARMSTLAKRSRGWTLRGLAGLAVLVLAVALGGFTVSSAPDGCVSCHTNRDLLKKLTPPPPPEPETGES